MSMIVSERDWVPTDILNLILDKLVEPRDHANIGAVCRDWYLARKNHIRKQPLLPMLMIPTQLYDDDDDDADDDQVVYSRKKRSVFSIMLSAQLDDDNQVVYSRTKKSLYSVSTGKIYDIPGLSVLDRARYCGSSHGWLLTLEDKKTIVLVNPFRNALTIRLPPLDFFPSALFSEDNVLKAVMTADPISNPDNYVVFVIYGGHRRLAFYKSSQNSWTYIDKSLTLFYDVIMYKGLAYAITSQGQNIISFAVNNNSSSTTINPWELKHFKPREPNRSLRTLTPQCLVESSQGELWQVQRVLERGDARLTETFQVFKLQLVHEKGEGIVERVEVKSLGNDAIFVGLNYSFVVSIDTPFRLCQPNSIYYTGAGAIVEPSLEHHHKDVGCFNFENKTFLRYYEYHPFLEWHTQMPHPLWVTPPLL
ncbi:hypothetical protein REPUB_Repub04eG0223700 [Reevesia pubescens]